jgi:hypothetical protein
MATPPATAGATGEAADSVAAEVVMAAVTLVAGMPAVVGSALAADTEAIGETPDHGKLRIRIEESAARWRQWFTAIMNVRTP